MNALLFCVFTPKVRKQFIFFLANTRCLRKICLLAPRPTDSDTPHHSLSSMFPVMRSKKCTGSPPIYSASSPTPSRESESRSALSDTAQNTSDGSQQQVCNASRQPHSPNASLQEIPDASQLEGRPESLTAASNVLQLRHARCDASQLVSMHQSDASIQPASSLGDRHTP